MGRGQAVSRQRDAAVTELHLTPDQQVLAATLECITDYYAKPVVTTEW